MQLQRSLAILIGLTLITSSTAMSQTGPSANTLFGDFLENQGQFPPFVRFVLRSSDAKHLFTDSGFVTCALSRDEGVEFSLLGASESVSPIGLDPTATIYSFFRGSDPRRWAADVPSFNAILFESVYPGVDIRFYQSEGLLEFDLVLDPNADLSSVMIRCRGAKALSIDSTGALLIQTESGELSQKIRKTYQVSETGTKQELSCEFELRGSDMFGFMCSGRHPGTTLVVDPTVHYATYLGGQSGDLCEDIAVDPSGSLYLVGTTGSFDFPTTFFAYDTFLNGLDDAFVARLSPDGSSLVFATFLGGNRIDTGRAIDIDPFGNVYVTGSTHQITNQQTFPTTSGCFDTQSEGGQHLYVSKLNPSGSSLLYSTFVGSSGTEGFDLVVDSSGAAFLVGSTSSSVFPSTGGAFQPANAGGTDGIIAKLKPDCTSLLYGSYIGGSAGDKALNLAVDSTGSTYVFGETGSPNFPTTAGVFDPGPGMGNFNTFVSKIDSTASQLLYSTYLQGSNQVNAQGIEVDSSGSAYLTGFTTSADYPTTAGAFQPVYAGGTRDGFVTKLNPSGSGLSYSTFLGGSGDDLALSLALDSGGRAYVGGSADAGFPTTFDAFASSGDIFLSKLSTDGSCLCFSSFYGGSRFGGGLAIQVDAASNLYLAGRTDSLDFPVTPGAFDVTYNGGARDVFVSKMSIGSFSSQCPCPWPSLNVLPPVPGLGGTCPSGIVDNGQDLFVTVKWCCMIEAPSCADPTLVCRGPTDWKTMLWRRHEFTSDSTWIPQCRLSFRSGGAVQHTDYEEFNDTDLSVGDPGDVVISPLGNEFFQTFLACDQLWSDQPKGVLSISANKLIDDRGCRIASHAAFVGSKTMPWMIIEDPSIQCDNNERAVGHAGGHVLSLPHDTAAGNLMAVGGQGRTLTKAQCDQARCFFLDNQTCYDPGLSLNLIDFALDAPAIDGHFPELDIRKIVAIDNSQSGGDLALCVATKGILGGSDTVITSYWFMLDVDNDGFTGGNPTSLVAAATIQGVEYVAEVRVEGLNRNTTAILYESMSGGFVPTGVTTGLEAEIHDIDFAICGASPNYSGPDSFAVFTELVFRVSNSVFSQLGFPAQGPLFGSGLGIQAAATQTGIISIDVAPDQGRTLPMPEITFPGILAPICVTPGQFSEALLDGFPPNTTLKAFFRDTVIPTQTGVTGEAAIHLDVLSLGALASPTLLTVGVDEPLMPNNALTADVIIEVKCSTPPSISFVEPNRGGVEGGELVEIHGNGFSHDMLVFFGPVAAEVQSVQETSVRVKAPLLSDLHFGPGRANVASVLRSVTVTVVTPCGADSLRRGYTYSLD